MPASATPSRNGNGNGRKAVKAEELAPIVVRDYSAERGEAMPGTELAIIVEAEPSAIVAEDSAPVVDSAPSNPFGFVAPLAASESYATKEAAEAASGNGKAARMFVVGVWTYDGRPIVRRTVSSAASAIDTIRAEVRATIGADASASIGFGERTFVEARDADGNVKKSADGSAIVREVRTDRERSMMSAMRTGLMMEHPAAGICFASFKAKGWYPAQ